MKHVVCFGGHFPCSFFFLFFFFLCSVVVVCNLGFFKNVLLLTTTKVLFFFFTKLNALYLAIKKKKNVFFFFVFEVPSYSLLSLSYPASEFGLCMCVCMCVCVCVCGSTKKREGTMVLFLFSSLLLPKDEVFSHIWHLHTHRCYLRINKLRRTEKKKKSWR